jgi:hypothetical protein
MTENNDYRLIPAYSENGEESGYYTREPDGVSGMSVSALTRFCGLALGSTTAISNLLRRVEETNPETNDLPESLKPFAGRALRLETNDPQGRLIVPDEVCLAVTEYYAFDARGYQGQEAARNNFRMAGRAGMRVFIWSQTGFVPELLRESLRANTTTYIERLENIRDHDIGDTMWSTFREGAEVLLLVEKEMGVPVDQLDLCDGSIGSHWSTYREGQPWARGVGTYRHVFRDHRGERFPRAYDLSELSYFRQWLRNVYIPYHLPAYLADKYGKLAARDIYERIGGFNERVEEVTRIGRMTPRQQQFFESYQKLRQRLLRAPIDQEQLELPQGE